MLGTNDSEEFFGAAQKWTNANLRFVMDVSVLVRNDKCTGARHWVDWWLREKVNKQDFLQVFQGSGIGKIEDKTI